MARKPIKGPARKDAKKPKSRKSQIEAPAKAVVKAAPATDVGGRPTTYTEDLGLEVCEHIASGLSLRSIEAIPGMPARTTVLRWALEDRGGFNAIYVRARELQLEAEADEIVDISDDGKNDWMERETGRGETITVLNKEAVDRSKLRVETRKWRLQRLMGNRYGDKIEQKHTGDAAFAAVWQSMGQPKK